ncbi:MAG: type II toxin-antitoxin system RelB/DinJ family antitoxin [Chloroflexota bacterium]|nr:type II toxin-antitoxin system RelB/DinJ family antitoxin [Chloroflexota bacterium]
MAATAIVRVRVDSDVKDEATRILADIGLTPSWAVRVLFERIVAEQTFPRSLLKPTQPRSRPCKRGRTGTCLPSPVSTS